jgi:NAD(P)-dependent dehydrogenase (short-subunit alcohol dehydrogenase family)
LGRLTDRVAIITGAGEGIGHGFARVFASEGAKVLVADYDESLGRRAVEELQRDFGAHAIFTHTDVREKEQVQAMVEAAVDTWGTIDVLVNNAWGGGTLRRVEFKSDDEMQHGFAVGFQGPLWAMQAAFPTMKAKGYGRIINMCSLNGVNAHMGTAEYNSAKEALRALTRTAAREWAPYGITANVICPAAKSASFRRVAKENPGMLDAADAMNPMGRIGDPENDIAPVALFLASEDSRYLTGNTLFVDGGGHINGASWAPELPDE